jgi:hypothetical protein
MNNLFNKIYHFILILIPANCFCQSIGNSDIANVTKITFFNPGISFEKRIKTFQSLYVQIFMNTSFSIGYSEALGNTSSLYFDPAATLQYRYYYNSAAREAKGKRIEMNSINYVSFILETTLITERILLVDYTKKEHYPLIKFGAGWGFQRNYKKRFSIDLNFGVGSLFAKTTTNGTGQLAIKNIRKFTTLGQLNLGFWLNRAN